MTEFQSENEEGKRVNIYIEKKKSDLGKGIFLGLLIGLLISSIVYLLLTLTINVKNTPGSFGAKAEKEPSSSIHPMDEAVLKKINSIEKLIDANMYYYNEELSADHLEEGIYKGMIKSLGDKYAEYYSVEEVSELMNDYEGVSYGIGCYVSIDEETNMPLVYGVFEGSPAEEAGVKEGDIIAFIEGESTAGLSLTGVVDRIKGVEGTKVNITFSRDGEYIDMDVVRQKLIEDTTVNYGQLVEDETIGYIRIKEFGEVTVNQFSEALEDLREAGIRALILDLRSNPGGSLTAVIDVSRELLPEGLILYTESSKGIRKEYTCDGSKEIDIPVVVLVNNYTASASEILSGSLQDYNKAVVVGTRTYGKGIVQSLLEVGDGSIVKLTTQAYFTPSGRNIQGTGIEPDVVIEYDYDLAEQVGEDNQLTKAVEILKEKLGAK